MGPTPALMSEMTGDDLGLAHLSAVDLEEKAPELMEGQNNTLIFGALSLLGAASFAAILAKKKKTATSDRYPRV